MVTIFNYFDNCVYAMSCIKYAGMYLKKMDQAKSHLSHSVVMFVRRGQGALTFSSDEDNLFALRLGRPVELRWDGKI